MKQFANAAGGAGPVLATQVKECQARVRPKATAPQNAQQRCSGKKSRQVRSQSEIMRGRSNQCSETGSINCRRRTVVLCLAACRRRTVSGRFCKEAMCIHLLDRLRHAPSSVAFSLQQESVKRSHTSIIDRDESDDEATERTSCKDHEQRFKPVEPLHSFFPGEGNCSEEKERGRNKGQQVLPDQLAA